MNKKTIALMAGALSLLLTSCAVDDEIIDTMAITTATGVETSIEVVTSAEVVTSVRVIEAPSHQMNIRKDPAIPDEIVELAIKDFFFQNYIPRLQPSEDATQIYEERENPNMATEDGLWLKYYEGDILVGVSPAESEAMGRLTMLYEGIYKNPYSSTEEIISALKSTYTDDEYERRFAYYFEERDDGQTLVCDIDGELMLNGGVEFVSDIAEVFEMNLRELRDDYVSVNMKMQSGSLGDYYSADRAFTKIDGVWKVTGDYFNLVD